MHLRVNSAVPFPSLSPFLRVSVGRRPSIRKRRTLASDARSAEKVESGCCATARKAFSSMVAYDSVFQYGLRGAANGVGVIAGAAVSGGGAIPTSARVRRALVACPVTTTPSGGARRPKASAPPVSQCASAAGERVLSSEADGRPCARLPRGPRRAALDRRER